ncbi:hypothetical protein M8542_43050 [Amycolatopsis sp. OK19-0408]|uniref:Uncharacterized protein n=1 Tax=Amycolatopsis iheyensis TaxID=2945988 RepID=A0A9X2NPT5_9PSEU|nr:hypothetical protein [Amycolatopsis iheyensis]MCR6489615.1 hypothetical protein [Amycolatopsis iheyensis]
MKTTIKVAVCALVAGLAAPPVSTAATPLSGVDPAVLDPSRSAVFHGSATDAEAVHRARLGSGPQGAALYDLAESSGYVVQTTPAMLAAGAEIDPVTFDECQAHQVTPEKPFWYKNKYNACSSESLGVQYWEIGEEGPYLAGTSVFTRSSIAIAQAGENRVKFGVRLVHDYDLGRVDDGTTLALKIGCLETDLDPNRVGTCTVSPGEVKKTLGQWKAEQGANPAWFESTMVMTKVPADKYSAEKRGYFSVDEIATTEDSTGVRTVFHPAANVRCDEATYVSGSRCVFQNVASSLALYTSDPRHGESAKFIKDAQTDLVLTYPGLLGKKVPGRWGEEPLHRLYKDYDTEHDIAGSRRKVRRACQVRWGVGYTLNAAGEVLQCDEYPFATTYENSARVDDSTQFTYAVRPVNALQNETAGQVYAKWLADDHILDGDPFYVIIY